MTPAAGQAARITGTLWEAVRLSGGIRAGDWRHYPGAADRALLDALPLPAAARLPAGQPVALLDGTGRGFERLSDPDLLCIAYRELPRTLVFEDIGYGDPDGWPALACSHLTRLTRSALPVVCTVYASAHGDETMGAHRDAWLGAVVQVSGVKEWRLGEGLLGAGHGPAAVVTMRPGDILVVPWGMPHDVTTPQDPGYSMHLAFAIGRLPPGGTARRPGEPEPVCALCHKALSQCRRLRSPGGPRVPGDETAEVGHRVDEPLVPEVSDGLAGGVTGGAGLIDDPLLGRDEGPWGKLPRGDGRLDDRRDAEVKVGVAGGADAAEVHEGTLTARGRLATVGNVRERS
jgi:Cupin superfamily protein